MPQRKYRGSPAIAANAVARASADAVVARIPSATDYMKDNVWQWAFNESMAGRLSKIKHIWIARLDSTSAYIDLITGNVATDNGVGTHVAQDGISLASRQIVRMGVDLTAEYASPLDWSMGIYVSAAAHGAGNHGLIMNNNGTATARYISQNASGQIGGMYGGAAPAYIPGTTKPDWLNKVIQGAPGEDGIDVQTLNDSGEDLGSNFGDFAQADIYINSDNAGNNGTMTFGMAYVADSDINFTGFATNTEALMSALARTAPAFSSYFQDGDSLQTTDASYQGMVSYMQNQPGISYSGGGRSLADIAGSIDANLALQAVDDVLIGAGTNDINIDSASEATVTGYIDDIIASFQSAKSAGDVNQMIMRTLPPFRGVWFPNYWTEARQATTEAVNAYLLNDVSQIDGVTVVDIYATLNSTSLPTYIKGDYYSSGWMPSPDSYTHPDDPNYSFDGLHLNAAGAQACADLLDYTIRELRYYKGGRA